MNLSVSELNQSCEEARLFGIQVLSDDVEAVLRYIAIGFLSLFFPFSVCLTSFTIFLIIRFKHLRQTTFLLPMQLVILDLLISITHNPLAIIGAVYGRWIHGLPFCRVVHAELLFTYQCRNWLMFIFVFDRFWTVFAPFRYPKYRNKIIWSLNVLLLVLSSQIDLVVPFSLSCSGFERASWNCFGPVAKECYNYDTCQHYVYMSIVWGLSFGSFIPLIMYSALFIKAKKVRNQIVVASTPDDGEQRKRDRKANLTFFAIFLSLFGVACPPIFAFTIINTILVPLGIQPPEFFLVMIYLLQGLFPILPIADSIAILRNPEVRKATGILKSKLRLWIGVTTRPRQQEVTTRQQEIITEVQSTPE